MLGSPVLFRPRSESCRGSVHVCAVATCVRGHIFSKYVPQIFVRMPDIGGEPVTETAGPRLSFSMGPLHVCHRKPLRERADWVDFSVTQRFLRRPSSM